MHDKSVRVFKTGELDTIRKRKKKKKFSAEITYSMHEKVSVFKISELDTIRNKKKKKGQNRPIIRTRGRSDWRKTESRSLLRGVGSRTARAARYSAAAHTLPSLVCHLKQTRKNTIGQSAKVQSGRDFCDADFPREMRERERERWVDA